MVGLLVVALVSFIGPRLLARHLTKRIDRAMSEINSAGPHFASDRNAGYELASPRGNKTAPATNAVEMGKFMLRTPFSKNLI